VVGERRIPANSLAVLSRCGRSVPAQTDQACINTVASAGAGPWLSEAFGTSRLWASRTGAIARSEMPADSATPVLPATIGEVAAFAWRGNVAP